MSGQSIARWNPSQTSSIAVEWCFSENVSPTPRTMTSKLDMYGLHPGREGSLYALKQSRRDCDRTVLGDILPLTRKLLQAARAHLRKLRVGRDEDRFDFGSERAVHVRKN